MKTYYKATRPDGTDFRTGTVPYAEHLASGKPLKRLTSESYECCTNTVYHASDTPSETLIGGEWPCRLFEVTGRPVAEEGHKFGFRSMRVVREVEAWQALGPNGQEVVALIERAGRLTEDETGRLATAGGAARGAPWVAAWVAARDAAWGAARGAAGDAAWDAARAAAGDAAWDAVWGAARDAARVAAGDAAGDAARGAARVAAWGAARYAARDAARALVVKDLVGQYGFTQEHFDLLYGPWKAVMGS